MNVDVAKANSAHISCDVLCHTVHTHAHTFAIHPFAPIIFWMNSKNRSKKVQMITYPQNDEIRCAQRVKKEQQRYNTHSDKAMQSAKRKMIYMNTYTFEFELHESAGRWYSFHILFRIAHKYMKCSLACTEIFINIWWMLVKVFS